jgi:hypothetical protein
VSDLLIKRQDAIDAILSLTNCDTVEGLRAYVIEHDLGSWWNGGVLSSVEKVERLPSAQQERKKGEWTTEEVAELLFNIFGDDCACNFNGIDEWLPERCKYTEIAGECPNPKEKHGCWMQFLLQGGADMRGEEE